MSKPALTDSSLAAKRRADALHVVFFPTKHPSPPRRRPTTTVVAAGAAVVYSRLIRSHIRRALGALLFLVSRSEPAFTDS